MWHQEGAVTLVAVLAEQTTVGCRVERTRNMVLQVPFLQLFRNIWGTACFEIPRILVL